MDQWQRALPRMTVWLIVAALGARLAFDAWDKLADLLVVAMTALFIACAMEPAVRWLERRRVRRGLASGFVLLASAGTVAALFAAAGAVIASQASNLAGRLPSLVADSVRTFNRLFDTHLQPESFTAPGGPLDKAVDAVTEQLMSAASSAIGGVGQVLTIMFVAFYMSAEGPRMITALCSLLPPQRQRHVLRVIDTAIAKTGGYLSSRMVLAVLSALVHTVTLAALGVPYALPLGVWVGFVSQLVPVVGTYLAATLPVVVALSSGSLTTVLVLLGVIVAYQQFENTLLVPKITRAAVDLHPVTALLAVIVGSRVAGAAGGMLAVPAAATIVSVVSASLQTHTVVDDDSALLDR